MEKKELSVISNNVFIYTLITLTINAAWSFMFLLGSYIGTHKSDFFNDVIAPNFYNIYGLMLLIGLVILLVGGILLRLKQGWAFKLSLLGVWIYIIYPSLTVIYTLLLLVYKKADIPNLVGMVIPIGISVGIFYIAKHLIFHSPQSKTAV